jgi:hypothetical protein
MTPPRIAGCLTLVAVAVVLAASIGTRSSGADRAPAPAAVAPGLERQGVASCAASGCHHGNGPRGARGSEYTTWLVHDPHARAHEVLLSERSALIERNFRHVKNLADARAESDALCLNCHVQPDALAAPHRPRYALADGVGCESCHGPAQKWLEPHKTWKGLAPEAKKRAYSEHGMTWLPDLATRVQVCGTCHVGTPQADVNHDLIAAGHPRLTFEFAAYQAHMPRHWDEKEEKARYPDFEARAWAIGQVACARASLELLAARSERTWPEFAEYNCFACHKELNPGRRPDREAVRGQAPWTNWPYVLLPEALELSPGESNPNILSELNDLRRIMRRPLPPSAVVAMQARGTAERLQRWLDASSQGKYGDLPELIRTREKIWNEEKRVPVDWDTSMQRYLGMSALVQAQRALQREPVDPEILKELEDFSKRLRFPAGYVSPREAGHK